MEYVTLDGSEEGGRRQCRNRVEVGFNALVGYEMRASMRWSWLVIY
jgi:hypothetical protein